jgi:hypothetical protein
MEAHAGSESGREAALHAYLAMLAGGTPATSFLELRIRIDQRRWVPKFVPAHDRATMVREILARCRSADVYVGCAPRSRRDGTKDAVEQVWTLWAECDGPGAVRAVQSFRPRPAVVIGSGSGVNCHAYWPLCEPLAPAQAEAANLKLAHAVGADLACFDAARILRPPGTWNHKHVPPTPVTALTVVRGVTFEADRVVGQLPEIDDRRVQRRWQEHPQRDTSKDPLLRIAPDTYVADLLGVRPGRDRKVRCPFHEDERPSLHVYPTPARGWTCFSCGRGGSIYDLAAEIWGMETRGREFLELRARLVERFTPEIAMARALARVPQLGRGE